MASRDETHYCFGRHYLRKGELRKVRTAALIVGTFGGFAGVYFAQLLVTGTAFFGVIAAAFGAKNAQEPLYYGLAVLAIYTVGIIGGILAIPRAGTAP